MTLKTGAWNTRFVELQQSDSLLLNTRSFIHYKKKSLGCLLFIHIIHDQSYFRTENAWWFAQFEKFQFRLWRQINPNRIFFSSVREAVESRVSVPTILFSPTMHSIVRAKVLRNWSFEDNEEWRRFFRQLLRMNPAIETRHCTTIVLLERNDTLMDFGL